VAVAESAPQADTRSVCVIRTTNLLTDTEHHPGLSAIAEPLTPLDLQVHRIPTRDENLLQLYGKVVLSHSLGGSTTSVDGSPVFIFFIFGKNGKWMFILHDFNFPF